MFFFYIYIFFKSFIFSNFHLHYLYAIIVLNYCFELAFILIFFV